MVFHLPNRVYYRQIQDWDTAQLEQRISNLFAYASLELISFIVLAFLLKRRMHLSTLHQLAFVLEKQWAGVQSRILVWVMFLVQGSIEHYGRYFMSVDLESDLLKTDLAFFLACRSRPNIQVRLAQLISLSRR